MAGSGIGLDSGTINTVLVTGSVVLSKSFNTLIVNSPSNSNIYLIAGINNQTCVIKNINIGLVTIIPFTGNLIEGAINYQLLKGNSIQLLFFNGSWYITNIFKNNSPTFTGNPQAPTPALTDSSNAIATTAFVKGQGYGGGGGGGGGNVTTIGVTSANGISGTSSGGDTPSLTISLGAITPSSVNGLVLSALLAGFSITGGTTSKIFQVNKTVTLDAASDGHTLNIGTGGTLGSAAFTTSASYVLASAVGAASGVCPLGSDSKVSNTYLPTFVTTVGITSANGVSGSSSGGTTPNLTITLGDITPTSVNGITQAALATGFNLTGGVASKTLQINKTITLDAASDSHTLNIGSGGTLGTAAFTPTTDYALSAAIGAASGICPLDAGSKIPTTYLPSSVVGSMVYQGSWDALANSPTLVSGVGTKGYFYKVGTAGTTAIDGNANWNIGDFIAYNGTAWDKFDGPAEAVTMVNGLTGAITVAAINQTMYLGTTALTINGGSGTQTILDGMTSISSTAFIGALTGNCSGSSASFTGNLSGDVTSVGMTTSLADTVVSGKKLTGFSVGTDLSQLIATDTILSAFEKLQYQENLSISPIQTKSATYGPTILTDKVILCDASIAPFTITLLAAPIYGQTMVFKKIDDSTHAVTIDGNGKLIDGDSTFPVNIQWNAVVLIFDGVAWYAF